MAICQMTGLRFFDAVKLNYFEFLSKNLIKDIDMVKCLAVMFDDAVLTNQPIDVTDLVPCTIEKSE